MNPPALDPPPVAPALPERPLPPDESARPSALRWRAPRWLTALLALLVLALAAALWMAWQTTQRVRSFEQELVRRQQDSAVQATEARVLAQQAQEVSRDAAAKVALLESRVAENTLQRSQLEELLQALSRSRDENMLADIDAAVRVSVQQSALTGSTEPLLAALRQADERLARNPQPRVERVRRAVAQDLERARAVAVSDISTLLIKLDEAVRLVDELPLLAQPDKRRGAAASEAARAPQGASAAASAMPSPAPAVIASPSGWREEISMRWHALVARVADEARALVRVTRIDQPDAMLVAPEQAYFLRENLKLRLLNARLALLSRQFNTAQSDLREVQSMTERYFDRSSRRVTSVLELVRQVNAQTRGLVVPRPDETLAALAAVLAGR